MSRDGYLPDNVRECDIPGNRACDEHHKACPCHDDAPELCVCGAEWETHKREDCEGLYKIDSSPDCICADLE